MPWAQQGFELAEIIWPGIWIWNSLNTFCADINYLKAKWKESEYPNHCVNGCWSTYVNDRFGRSTRGMKNTCFTKLTLICSIYGGQCPCVFIYTEDLVYLIKPNVAPYTRLVCHPLLSQCQPVKYFLFRTWLQHLLQG